MPPFLVRGIVALALVSLIALAWSTRAIEERASTHATTREPHASASPSLGFGSTTSPVTTSSLPYFVPDGGGFFAGYDAGVPEPRAATGALAAAITPRLCPESARVICAARDRLLCGSMEDDEASELGETCTETIERQCREWVERRYSWVEDDLVVDEDALTACLDALRSDVTHGEQFVMDMTCSELAAEDVREGEACRMEMMPCGQDGICMAGTCSRFATLGEPCVETRCSRDLACVAGLCDRPIPHGAACDIESLCADRRDACIEGRCASFVPSGACEFDGDCDVGSGCVLGRCEIESGTTCTLPEDCGRGRTCLGAYVARCEAYVHEAEPCENDDACGPWLGCVEGRCGGHLRGGTGREDEPCSTSDASSPGEPTECRRGLVCLYGDDGYRCVRGSPVGASCEETPCAVEANCVWRVDGGRCAAALCDVVQAFVDSGEE